MQHYSKTFRTGIEVSLHLLIVKTGFLLRQRIIGLTQKWSWFDG